MMTAYTQKMLLHAMLHLMASSQWKFHLIVLDSFYTKHIFLNDLNK